MPEFSEIQQVSTMADADTFVITVGAKSRQLSKSDLESGLTVTSQQVLDGIVNDNTTARTAVSSDVFKWVRMNNASAITVTINAAASQGWSVLDVVYFRQVAAGAITLAAGSGVTLNGDLSTALAGDDIAAIYLGNDVWDVAGGV
jgi:hypothetical protein